MDTACYIIIFCGLGMIAAMAFSGYHIVQAFKKKG